ncbi:MAG TPA: bifunctional serine/threonine-protein kinase/formylglycine-generating enzyme family protein [Pyrinomonadaceae bacterium]
MRECPACLKCYDDSVSQCPDDGRPTFNSLPGDLALDGRYLLERRLGEGGMGVVYKAHHKFLKTTRAVKVIKPELVGNDPSFATRFQQEAMAAAAIGHPNIISVPDYGFLGGEIPFLVMEFVEGKSLQDVMVEEGRFPPDKAFEYMKVIASAIGAAHANGIVHRDLKPLNIMINLRGNDSPSEQIRILDFGLAKIKSGDLFGSFVGAKTTGIIGSPYYMAPEQWSDEETDKRCDIYSLGIILYQMLSGDVPFKGTSIPAVMKKHLMSPPPPFNRTAGISPELETVVLHALEKEPKNRTSSCEELIAELEAAMAAAPVKGRGRGRPKAKTAKTTTKARGSSAARNTAEQLKAKPDQEEVARSTAEQTDTLLTSQPDQPASPDDGTLLLSEQESAEIRKSQELSPAPGEIEITPDSAATIVQPHISSHDLLNEEPPAPPIVSSGQRPFEDIALQKAAEQARQIAKERAIREASGDYTSATRGTSLPPRTPPPVVKQVTGPIPVKTDLPSNSGLVAQIQKPLVLGIGIAVLLSLIGIVALIKFWPSSKVDVSTEAHNVPLKPTREMAFIKGGSFNMGSDGGSDAQRPVHLVSVVDFYLDKKEVTNAEYSEFVKATGHAVPTLDENDPAAHGGYWRPWNGTEPPSGWSNFPVCNVSAHDAEDFAAWLSKREGTRYRLPTEAEWEYAARNGSTNSLFPWGNSWVEGRANLNGRSGPRDVGSFPEGASQSGLLDMIGNVWEWTSSRASYYDQKKVSQTEVTAYVRRGGSFADRINKDFTNAADRTWYGDERYKFPTIGFRLARDAQ